MSKSDELQRESIILAHRYLYYVLGLPRISDYQYDKLEEEFLNDYPENKMIRSIGSDRAIDYSENIRKLALLL